MPVHHEVMITEKRKKKETKKNADVEVNAPLYIFCSDALQLQQTGGGEGCVFLLKSSFVPSYGDVKPPTQIKTPYMYTPKSR